MPHSYEILQWFATGSVLLFVFAFGACIGSLTNVLVYRLPLGLNVVTPSSRCPACGSKLTWRENIPILGWLILRGRCRFCRSKISPEYPIVEALVACLFLGLYLLWYAVPAQTWVLGVNLGAIRPEWAMNDRGRAAPAQTWPIFLVFLTLLSTLVSMTIIDARTYTIPLVLPWTATLAAVVIHPIAAAWVQLGWGGGLGITAPGESWSLPTPGWDWIGLSIGATVGLGVSLLLIRAKLIGRSFADFEQWATTQAAGQPVAADPPVTPGVEGAVPGGGGAAREGGVARSAAITIVAVAAAGVAGWIVSRIADLPLWVAPLSGVVIGPLVGAAVIGMIRRPTARAAAGSPAEAWVQYPHARREMVRELAFLAAPVLLGLVGFKLAHSFAGPWSADAMTRETVAAAGAPPLWLAVLGGVLTGYLVGGGVVWGVRILGSAAFGKEAMGMGDVHLMAAVGASLGWIDATLAFFGAAFVGLYWTVVSRLASGSLARAMPYGPFLAAATLLVVLCKPLIERGLTLLLQIPPGAGPINLP